MKKLYTLCCEAWNFNMDYYYGDTFEDVAKQAHKNGYEPNGTDYIALVDIDENGVFQYCNAEYYDW